MRKLNTQDVFKLARFIKKTDLKDTIMLLFEKGQSLNMDDNNKEHKTTEMGVEAFFSIMEKVTDEGMENEFYSLVAGVAEKTPDDIKNISLEALIDTLTQIAKENNVATFFKAAYQSAKKLTK